MYNLYATTPLFPSDSTLLLTAAVLGTLGLLLVERNMLANLWRTALRQDGNIAEESSGEALGPGRAVAQP